MGYLVRAYYNISPTRYYKDDPCWNADLKSKITKDIISIRSFVEVLVLNHYVLARKIFSVKPDSGIIRKLPKVEGRGKGIVSDDQAAQSLLNLTPNDCGFENKPDLDSMSFDDLYNNFKIVEQEVKRTITSSSNSGSHNMAFVLTPSSTNEVNTANVQVITASIFPNRTIHEDDLEEIYLKWQLALLSMRARRGPRNQESRARNQDSSRRTVNAEETASKAMVAIDGAGFDWSYMADDEVPTKMALKAFSDSEIKKTTDAPIIKDWVSDCDEDDSEVMTKFQKSHSLSKRPFYQQTTLKNRNLNDKVNTTKVNFVNIAMGNRVTSAVGEQGINAVKSSVCWVWRPKIKFWQTVTVNTVNDGEQQLTITVDGQTIAITEASVR
ncbi:hypothetical protein Tco_1002781 [Tanacetum coccineum]|uniref:Uncharacterized protein n=1 Tax=Tanacetum coccineum TaxID=301880 RepID=A0ABQ5F791_9ASTR